MFSRLKVVVVDSVRSLCHKRLNSGRQPRATQTLWEWHNGLQIGDRTFLMQFHPIMLPLKSFKGILLKCARGTWSYSNFKWPNKQREITLMPKVIRELFRVILFERWEECINGCEKQGVGAWLLAQMFLVDKMLQMPEWPTYSNHVILMITGSKPIKAVYQTVAEIHSRAHTSQHTPRCCQSCGLESCRVSLASAFRYCSLQWENTATTRGLTTGVRACGMQCIVCLVFWQKRSRGAIRYGNTHLLPENPRPCEQVWVKTSRK